METYCALHSHSEHSFIDGLSSTDQMAARAKELGQPAVAITDHGECSGHFRFEKSCESHGVQPIFGMEGYLCHDTERQKKDKIRENSHLVLLAENNVGLSNLWAISKLSYMERNFYYKPLADWSMLREYHEGIIGTSACLLSFMAKAILKEDFDEARWLVSQYQQAFGEDNFFLELHTFQIIDAKFEKDIELNRNMTKMNQGIVQLSKDLSIPTIVVNDNHFSRPEQAQDHSLVWMMSTNADQLENRPAANWHMNNEEIIYWMGEHGVSRTDTESAIANTAWIAQRCKADIRRKKHFPSVSVDGQNDLALFTDQIERGFKKKVIDAGLDQQSYADRVIEETDLIVPKNFHGYFNVVADYCKFAKSRNGDKDPWLVGASRGSAGASLVAYLMDITETDPVKYDLPFSRFISPGRKGFPDIDLDFPQSKRDELKEYLHQRYGEGHVCGIGTLSRLHAKSALRDVGKALEVPLSEINIMAKIIDKVNKIEPTWDDIMSSVGTELKSWIDMYPYLFEKVRSLNGLIRQSGTHASGILVSNEPLLGNLPLRRKKGEIVTQFEYQEVEELGYLKLDALGVRHLDTITRAWQNANPNEKFDPRYFYQFTDNEYQDPETWDQIATGDTLGVFQIETNLGITTTKKLRPRSERDVADLISVNRPGVIGAGALDEYLSRRNGEKSAVYIHPLLEPILTRTHGIVVYQEQVMAITVACAGYSLEGADKVREMMGKKLSAQMRAEKDSFIAGCMKNQEFVDGCGRSAPQPIASNIWDQIEASGEYAFGLAHAQGYSFISCWGAWFKTHFYREYMTACLQTDPKKTPDYLSDLKRHDVSVLPPDINVSGSHFTLTDEGLRFGLSNVKYLGIVAQREIIEKRPYVGLEDFLEKREKKKCNDRIVANLIRIGAFDTLGPRDVYLKKFYELVGKLDAEIPDFSDPKVVRAIEVELFGLYISSSPMDPYLGELDKCVLRTDDLKEEQNAEVGGLIHRVKEIEDKKGNKMAFLDVARDDIIVNITIFSDKYEKYKFLLAEDAPVKCDVVKLKKGVALDKLNRLDF